VPQPISTVLPQAKPTHSPGSLIAASALTAHYCYQTAATGEDAVSLPPTAAPQAFKPRLTLTTTGFLSSFSARRSDCCSSPQHTVTTITTSRNQPSLFAISVQVNHSRTMVYCSLEKHHKKRTALIPDGKNRNSYRLKSEKKKKRRYELFEGV
jgi:hypothetical protein